MFFLINLTGFPSGSCCYSTPHSAEVLCPSCSANQGFWEAQVGTHPKGLQWVCASLYQEAQHTGGRIFPILIKVEYTHYTHVHDLQKNDRTNFPRISRRYIEFPTKFMNFTPFFKIQKLNNAMPSNPINRGAVPCAVPFLEPLHPQVQGGECLWRESSTVGWERGWRVCGSHGVCLVLVNVPITADPS